MPLVRLLVAAGLQPDWRMSTDIQTLAARLFMGFINFAIVEDCAKKLRACEQQVVANKLIAKPSVWHLLIKHKILTGEYNFKEVDREGIHLSSADGRYVPRQLFEAPPGCAPLMCCQ